MNRCTVNVFLGATVLACLAPVARAQTPAAPAQQQETLDNSPLEAGDEELDTPKKDLVKFNHYDGDFFHIRFGAGYLYEGSAYSQNAESEEQFSLVPETKVRDARFLIKGGFKTKRPITFSTGILYDTPTHKFLVRETGVMFTVPEIWGWIFVGRTKEGFSLNKVMVGYAGWTMERTEISDATIPILADGIKWLGYVEEKHILWNLGFFGDWLSEGQTFSTYERQVVGRFAWVPEENDDTVLHLGTSLRWGKVEDGQLQLRSRPEDFEAPYFVDTGKFPADSTKMIGLEAYYRPKSLLVGSEYFLQSVNSPQTGNPFFHGGQVVVSWLPTGEIRPYNTRGGFFDQVSPLRPLFQGGPGGWELVANFSYVDLDSRGIQGGKFWRVTPMANWFLSDNVRLEFAYGYGTLNRFGIGGGVTQFFQTRIQLQL
jgi:phosphate-selective porin OprO/OprP